MFSLDGQRPPFNNDLGMQNKKYKIFISFIHFKLSSQCLWLIHTRDSDGDNGLARRGGEVFQEWSISFVHQSSQLSQLSFSSIRKSFSRPVHQPAESQWAGAGQALVQRRLQAHLRRLDGRPRGQEVVRGPRWG